MRLPTAAQTAILRAALSDAPTSGDAFAEWLCLVDDPLAGLVDPASSDRRLLALLYHSLCGQERTLSGSVRSRLRAVTAHEDLRAQVLAGAGGEIVTALQRAEIEPTLVGGAAVACRAYPSMGLRHCHNVDLLVAPGELASARAALGSVSCDLDRGRLLITHASGSRITVLERLYLESLRQHPQDLDRAVHAVTLGGATVGALAPADSVVEMCAYASFCVDPGLRWLADCALLIATGDVDWQRVGEHASLARAARATARTLEWLAVHLDLPAPQSARSALTHAGRLEGARDVLGAAFDYGVRRRRWLESLPGARR